MPTCSIQLTEHDESFIAGSIKAGRYSNPSEVVGEGLRLLEQREAEDRAKSDRLRSAADDAVAAIERGEYITLQSPEAVQTHLRALRTGR